MSSNFYGASSWCSETSDDTANPKRTRPKSTSSISADQNVISLWWTINIIGVFIGWEFKQFQKYSDALLWSSVIDYWVMSGNGEEQDSIISFEGSTEESYNHAEGEEELQEISMDDPVRKYLSSMHLFLDYSQRRI